MNLALARHPEASLAWRDITFTVRDGLRLFARHYPAAHPTGRRPVLCLAGTTENGLEFEELALALTQARDLSRDVYTLDCRGRGRSDHDPDWRNYTPFIETLDVLDFLALARLHDVALVGTSRGGMLAMIMAAVRPAAMGAVVLNDIGPEVEAPGWMRLMGRVGRVPTPKNWAEAGRYVKDLDKRDFPRFTDAMWARVARRRYFDRNGAPTASYDPLISRAFSLTSISAGVPSMWPQFRALCRVPLLLVRGERSDVLSVATADAMQSLHPRMATITVANQGHAPLLDDTATTGSIVSFLAQVDGRPA